MSSEPFRPAMIGGLLVLGVLAWGCGGSESEESTRTLDAGVDSSMTDAASGSDDPDGETGGGEEGERSLESFEPVVSSVTTEELSDFEGCHFEHRISVLSANTPNACQASADRSFSPGGETRELQITVYTETDEDCDDSQQARCPTERLEIGEHHGYALDNSKEVTAAYVFWDEEGEKVESREAESGYLDFHLEGCGAEAVLKFVGEPVQKTFEIDPEGPEWVGETSCTESS